MKHLYEQYAVKPNGARCKGCEFNQPAKGRIYGNCSKRESSAYYAQLDGFCPKIEKELKERKNGTDKEDRLHQLSNQPK